MQWFKNLFSNGERFPAKQTYEKSLSEFTEDELYKILKKNEETDARTLACICSEILRRILKEEIDKDESTLSSDP